MICALVAVQIEVLKHPIHMANQLEHKVAEVFSMISMFSRTKLGLALAIAAAVLFCPRPARAMVINVTYDSTVTSLGNVGQIETSFGVAVGALEALYTNPITVNLTVHWGTPSLGMSSFGLHGNPSYTALTNALAAARMTAADSNAVANLPASNPIGSHVWWIPRAEAKALNLGVSPTDPSSDGTVSFNSSVTWTFDPTNRAVPGAYDFIAVAEHEMTECLGRCFDMNDNPTNGYVPFDLFHFTAPGVQCLAVTNDAGVYFSIDNGTTSLKGFNPDVGSGDVQDWEPGAVADSFDFQLFSGTEGVLSAVDLTALDILGYDLHFTPPTVTAVQQANGHVTLSFTNVTGLGFFVLASTNITLPTSSWTTLGAPVETAAGHYQFTDTTAGHATRFYRVVLP